MKTLKSLLWILALASTSAMARDTYGSRAKAEFLDLKAAGDWTDYSEGKLYAEVRGTDFIALESAQSETRTCVYGFRLGELEPGLYEVKTKFLCFDAGKYELHVLGQACESIDTCPAPDPAGISVGIGNIREVEPKLGNIPGVDGVKGRYPIKISIEVSKVAPVGLPVDSLPRPSFPLR